MKCQLLTTIVLFLVLSFSQVFGQTISFTSESLVAIQSSGDLYALGQAKKYIPSNITEYGPFRKVDILMVGSSEYVLALTDFGLLYCWGEKSLYGESNWIHPVENFDCSRWGQVLIHYSDGTLAYNDFFSEDGAQKEKDLTWIHNELVQLTGDVCDISVDISGIAILTCQEELIRIPTSSGLLSYVPPQVQSKIVNIESGMGVGIYVTTRAGHMIYWNEELFDMAMMDHTRGTFGLQDNLEALDVEAAGINDIWILTKNGSVKRLNGMSALVQDPLSNYNYNPFDNYGTLVHITSNVSDGRGLISLSQFDDVYFINPYGDMPTWWENIGKEGLINRYTEGRYGSMPPFSIWRLDLDVKLPIGRNKRAIKIFDRVSQEVALGERRFITNMRTNPQSLIFTSILCTEQGERVSPYDLATMFEFKPPMSKLDDAIANWDSIKPNQSESEIPEVEAKVDTPNNLVNDKKNITFNKSPKGINVTTVAVLPIDGDDCNGNTVSGQDIASLTEGSLLGLYNIVERRYLERILDEQRLALSGVLYEQSAVEAGCNVGAQGIIFTEYGCLTGQETIQLKLVDCQTSELYWSATGVNATAQEILNKVRQELEGQ